MNLACLDVTNDLVHFKEIMKWQKSDKNIIGWYMFLNYANADYLKDICIDAQSMAWLKVWMWGS